MQGIVLCDDIGVATPALTAALETLFGNFTQVVRLAFLNSCHSEAQARALSTIGVECCIGTSDTIDDAEAFAFARTFYTAVAAGANTQSAFNQAIGALQAAGLPNSYRIFGPNPTNQILRVPQRIELVHYIAGRQTNPTSYMIRLAVRNTSNAVLRDYSVDIQNSNTFEVLRLIRENETYRRLIHGTVVENGQQIYRFNSIDQDRIHPAQSFDIACFNENNLADPNREIEIPYVVSHDGIQNRGTVRIRIGDLH
jgi:hypothetical protein